MSGTHTKQHSQQILLCEICGKNFANQSQLRNHTRLHVPIEQRRSFACYICKANFAYKKSLVHHMPSHSGQKIQYQCDECKSQFSRPDALRRHSLIHAGKTPHECQYCGKGFRTKFNLKVNYLIFTQKKYSLNFKFYRYMNESTLANGLICVCIAIIVRPMDQIWEST